MKLLQLACTHPNDAGPLGQHCRHLLYSVWKLPQGGRTLYIRCLPNPHNVYYYSSCDKNDCNRMDPRTGSAGSLLPAALSILLFAAVGVMAWEDLWTLDIFCNIQYIVDQQNKKTICNTKKLISIPKWWPMFTIWTRWLEQDLSLKSYSSAWNSSSSGFEGSDAQFEKRWWWCLFISWSRWL